MRFDTADIAHAVEHVRASTQPIDELLLASGLRVARLRTAVGTTPPVLRKPDTSDGVPIATADESWLDLIDV
jgi:hypothetical protein